MISLFRALRDERYRYAIDRKEWEGVSVYVLGILNLGFGVAIFTGGVTRFPPPSFTPLLRLTGGEVWPYALAFLVAGFLMLQADIRIQFSGAIIGVLGHNVFAAMFIVAVVQYPDASSISWIAYSGYAILNGGVAGLIGTHWGRVKPDRRQG